MKKRKGKQVSKRPIIVTFKTFFDRCVMQKKLKSWQYAEIKAFFSEHRLKDKEHIEVYESLLERY